MTDQPIRSDILDETKQLLSGERQVQYGPPEVNFQRIAQLWDIQFPEYSRVEPFTPEKVAFALLGVKVARQIQGYKRDTCVDLAGYAALIAELSENSVNTNS